MECITKFNLPEGLIKALLEDYNYDFDYDLSHFGEWKITPRVLNELRKINGYDKFSINITNIYDAEGIVIYGTVDNHEKELKCFPVEFLSYFPNGASIYYVYDLELDGKSYHDDTTGIDIMFKRYTRQNTHEVCDSLYCETISCLGTDFIISMTITDIENNVTITKHIYDSDPKYRNDTSIFDFKERKFRVFANHLIVAWGLVD